MLRCGSPGSLFDVFPFVCGGRWQRACSSLAWVEKVGAGSPQLRGDAGHFPPAASKVLGRAARGCKRAFKGFSLGKGAVMTWL